MHFRFFAVLVLVLALVSLIYADYGNAMPESNALHNELPIAQNLQARLASIREQDSVPVIVMLKQNHSVFVNSQDFEIEHYYKTINGFSGRMTKKAIEKLRKSNAVISITMDGPAHLMMTEARPLINATAVNKITYNGLNLSGKNQAVCVIDTGIDYRHFNLGNCTTEQFLDGNCARVLGGFNYCVNDACTETGNDPYDNHGHGTHVAGIIASNHTTYTGIAYNANLIAMKALNSQGTNPEGWGDIIDAIDWCVNNATKYNISVISMSIGSDARFNDTNECTNSGMDAVHLAIKNAVEHGILVVVSSGNNADPKKISYPSCSPNATSVGSVYESNYGGLAFSVCTDGSTQADKITCYSNGGVLLDLLAPGSRIVSLKNGGGTTTKDGTSMACPMVSGAALLLNEYKNWESGRNLSPIELKNAFVSSGKNITDTRSGADNSVYPRLDIYKALISIDSKKPVIAVSSPVNNSIYNYTQNLALNYTTNDIIGISECKYNLDDNSNVTLANCINASFNASLGAHNITLYVADKAGNINTTIISFSVDYFAPNIVLINAQNGSSISSGLLLNFTINDTHSQLDSAWWVNNTGERNNFTSNGGQNYYLNTSAWPSQIWQNVTVYANDSYNNTASVWFRFVNNIVPMLVMNISQQNWSEDSNLTLNLSEYFSDSDSALIYSVSTTGNITITIDQDSGIATLTPDADFYGLRSVFFYANDSFALNISDNVTLNITNVNDPPVFLHLENKTATMGYAFSYNASASDIDSINLNYTIINATNVTGAFINFTINQTTGIISNSTPLNSTGFYILFLNASDGINWTSAQFNLTINLQPIYDNFMNDLTTNFTELSNSEIENLTNFTIGIPWVGLINFSGHSVNLSGADLNSYVRISFNHIEIDSANLPQLSKPAHLTIYNLSFSTTPVVFRNGVQCSATICTNVNYDDGQNISFDVTSFSYYSAGTTSTTTTIAGSSSPGSSGANRITTTINATTTISTTSTVLTTIETSIIEAEARVLSREEAEEIGRYAVIAILILVGIGLYFYLRY